jgi:1,4-alpha-glucan branching enzyme
MARPNGTGEGQTTPEGRRAGMRYDLSLLTDDDLFLFNEGSHFHLWRKLGAHPAIAEESTGTQFAVWAPNADYVSVIGDFNGWDPGAHPLRATGQSGIWQGFVPAVGRGVPYKFHIASRWHGAKAEKADPFAILAETPPRSASVVWDLDYTWSDAEWMTSRAQSNSLQSAMSIYEVHLGSWMRSPEEDNRPLSYRELAPRLAAYVKELGFTHVEFLPIMEHPFAGSWGYQITGYFAPTSRFGTPQDFMFLIDTLHQHGIAVILDWVPSHFTTDGHGLGQFDGTSLYEHADPRQGSHPDWGSYIFNYGRNEVRSFLISNALFWLETYHIDGLRVDAVASMLYLDYSREDGEWIANQHGGRENLDAISFLRRFNEEVFRAHPDVQTFAEESTAWPLVSRPTYVGGLGFGLKWDMGWMHDILDYFSHDPIHRAFHHNQLTFRQLYANHENFVLPLSHDEVVHGKGSLLGRLPGDDWQRFANLRLLLAYMYAQPGKKLLFMGGEFGQWREWNHDESLDWHLLRFPSHEGVRRLVADLNRVYVQEPALHVLDCAPGGFEWLDCNDSHASVLSFMRRSRSGEDTVLAVFNFTPVPRLAYRVGAPHAGYWRELLNSDAELYGGSNLGNSGGVRSEATPCHGREQSLVLVLPPLAAVFLRYSGS